MSAFQKIRGEKVKLINIALTIHTERNIGKGALLENTCNEGPDPQVIKLFLMINLAEHEVCPAYQSQIIQICKFFLS